MLGQPSAPAPVMGYSTDQGVVAWLGTTTHLSGPSSSFNFTSQSFGAAYPTRVMTYAVHWIVGSVAHTLSSATIGGVTATINKQVGHTGGTTGLGVALISALVPLGTSGTVALTFSGSCDECAISPFRNTDLISATPFDTLSVNGINHTDISGSIDVPSNGALIIAGTGSTNTTGVPISFTGAAEVYDEDMVTDGRMGAALTIGLSAQGSRSCRFNMGSIPDSGTCMVAISFQLAA